jgi:hypothetical protein
MGRANSRADDLTAFARAHGLSFTVLPVIYEQAAGMSSMRGKLQ